MKLLHLIVDDKAISRLAPNLAKFKDVENKYVVLNENIKHINGIKFWRSVGREYLDSPLIKEDMRWADAVVIHFLFPLSAAIAMRAPYDVAVVWSGWGGDYYHLLPGGDQALISEQTARLKEAKVSGKVSKLDIVKSILPRLTIKRILRSMKYRLFQKSMDKRVLRKIIKRVDFFSAPIPDDYALLKNALGKGFRAEYIQINYASLEQVVKTWNVQLSGNDILLGNSATPTNNHADMLEMLSKINLGDRKVIVPLSYGDENYAKRVIELGKHLLGPNFYPVRDFLPLGEYNKLLSSCSVAIMNHRRQQALGNSVIMLYLGAKLFLDKEGVVYNFFIKKGALVYQIQEIEEFKEASFAPLSGDERQRNRNVLESIWGEAVVKQNYIKFIERIKKHRSANAD